MSNHAMDVNELVSTITQEVMKQVRGQKKKDCIMVLAERHDLLTGKIREILGSETDILFFGEESNGRTACRYILPFLSCNDMAGLAAGRATELYTAEVLNLLLRGTEVETLEFEYKAYSETAPGPLYSLYLSYTETLAAFGLKPLQPRLPDYVRFWQSLVTEKVINDAQQQGATVLQVPVAAKITPLAAETAKNLMINIQKCL